MRRHRLVVVTVLILAAVLGAALPALAAGNPTYYTAGRQTLIYTASSGGQPQGAIVAGQYIRLATEDWPPAGAYAGGRPGRVYLPAAGQAAAAEQLTVLPINPNSQEVR